MEGELPHCMRPGQRSKLGQNFLVDTGARRLIAEALGPAAAGTVVEIGPGRAAITELLAARATRLVAIELDSALAAALRTRYRDVPHIEILEADILHVDIAALATAPGRSLAIAGNLPYYITSPILQHLFAHEHAISRAVLMVQREVAERIVAVPGTSDYGLLTVLCAMYTRAELLFTLPPSAFAPPPAVHSAVIRLEFAPRWEEFRVAREPFVRFLKVCFAQKRKTLSNNLRAAGVAGTEIVHVLAESGLSAAARAEELSPPALAALFRLLQP